MIDKNGQFEVRLAAFDPERQAICALREHKPSVLLEDQKRWTSAHYYVPLHGELLVLLRRPPTTYAPSQADSADEFYLKITASGGTHRETCTLDSTQWKVWTCSKTSPHLAKYETYQLDCKGVVADEDTASVEIEPVKQRGEDRDVRYVFDFSSATEEEAHAFGVADTERPDFDDSESSILLQIESGLSHKFPLAANLTLHDADFFGHYGTQDDADVSTAKAPEGKTKSVPSTPKNAKREKAWHTEPAKRPRLGPSNSPMSPTPSGHGSAGRQGQYHKFRPKAAAVISTEAMVREEEGRLRQMQAELKTLRVKEMKMRAAHHDAEVAQKANRERLLDRYETKTQLKLDQLEEEFGQKRRDALNKQTQDLTGKISKIDATISFQRDLLHHYAPEIRTQAEQLVRDFEAVELDDSDDEMETERANGERTRENSPGDWKPAVNEHASTIEEARAVMDRLRENEALRADLTNELNKVNLTLKGLDEELESRQADLRNKLEQYTAKNKRERDLKLQKGRADFGEQEKKLKSEIAKIEAHCEQTRKYIAAMLSKSDIQPAAEDSDVEILSSGSEDQLDESADEVTQDKEASPM